MERRALPSFGMTIKSGGANSDSRGMKLCWAAKGMDDAQSVDDGSAGDASNLDSGGAADAGCGCACAGERGVFSDRAERGGAGDADGARCGALHREAHRGAKPDAGRAGDSGEADGGRQGRDEVIARVK